MIKYKNCFRVINSDFSSVKVHFLININSLYKIKINNNINILDYIISILLFKGLYQNFQINLEKKNFIII